MRLSSRLLPFLLLAGHGVLGMEMMTFRVLGPHERGRFAPDAWGHLLALTGSGALNAAELEHIIERALLQIDGRIALDDLRSLMEGAGFVERGDGDPTQTVH
jgi:uncharacterized protein Smg (DUF494 family)